MDWVSELAVGTVVEHQRRPHVEEVRRHHRDDDEENQNGLSEHVAVGVVPERHPWLVLDGLGVSAVLAPLHPAQVEKHDRADDRRERGELLDEGVELTDRVVGAQEAPEIEP